MNKIVLTHATTDWVYSYYSYTGQPVICDDWIRHHFCKMGNFPGLSLDNPLPESITVEVFKESPNNDRAVEVVLVAMSSPDAVGYEEHSTNRVMFAKAQRLLFEHVLPPKLPPDFKLTIWVLATPTKE
jgi:hypothetical protein